jgi:hypothetical protein
VAAQGSDRAPGDAEPHEVGTPQDPSLNSASALIPTAGVANASRVNLAQLFEQDGALGELLQSSGEDANV